MNYIQVFRSGDPGVPGVSIPPSFVATLPGYSEYTGDFIQVGQIPFGTPSDDPSGRHPIFHGGIYNPIKNCIMYHAPCRR